MTLKLVLTQVAFRSLDENPEPLEFDVAQFLGELQRQGFALRSGASTVRAADGRTILLTANMIGDRAWVDAWSKPHEAFRFNKECIRRQSDGTPVVRVFRKSVSRPFPTCRCRGGKPLALQVWSTPGSGCPPLLCADRGVFPMYRLGLSRDTVHKLFEWNEVVALTASLAGPLENRIPYGSWGAKELHSKRSWINREATQLAERVHAETGIKASATVPPMSVLHF